MTGLYYYDPWTSVWQSPDPILGENMSGKTNGGVFNPKNLSLFGYTYGNPVNLVDPDGNEVSIIFHPITIILSPPPKYYINFAKMILFLYHLSQKLVSLFWW